MIFEKPDGGDRIAWNLIFAGIFYWKVGDYKNENRRAVILVNIDNDIGRVVNRWIKTFETLSGVFVFLLILQRNKQNTNFNIQRNED